jgi:hypothetical protein
MGKFLKSLFVDFWMVPPTTFAFSRILFPFFFLFNLNTIFRKSNFKYLFFLFFILFSYKNIIDNTLYVRFLIPLVFGAILFLIFRDITDSLLEKTIIIGIKIALLLNISFYLLHLSGVNLLDLYYKFNFAAIKGDDNLISVDRFSLPFVNPARLGFFAGFSTLFLLKKGKYMYSLLAILILVASGARSSLFALLLTIILFNFRKNWKLITVTLLIGIFAFLNLDTRIFDFSEQSIYRHILLRDRTINEISNFNTYDWFFGKGIGQSEPYIDGSYSFTVPLTILFETGITGLISFLMFFKYNKTKFQYLFFIIITMMLYEIKSEPFFWIFLAYISNKNLNE